MMLLVTVWLQAGNSCFDRVYMYSMTDSHD